MTRKTLIIPVSPTFLKSQLSSVISTLVDFLVTLFLAQILGLWYLMASCLGTITGGFVNFSLGRNWTFQYADDRRFLQAARYILIWSVSLLSNVYGLYLLTEVFRIQFIISKIIVSVIVGVLFNYHFQKIFVFKHTNELDKNKI